MRTYNFKKKVVPQGDEKDSSSKSKTGTSKGGPLGRSAFLGAPSTFLIVVYASLVTIWSSRSSEENHSKFDIADIFELILLGLIVVEVGITALWLRKQFFTFWPLLDLCAVILTVALFLADVLFTNPWVSAVLRVRAFIRVYKITINLVAMVPSLNLDCNNDRLKEISAQYDGDIEEVEKQAADMESLTWIRSLSNR